MGGGGIQFGCSGVGVRAGVGLTIVCVWVRGDTVRLVKGGG